MSSINQFKLSFSFNNSLLVRIRQKTLLLALLASAMLLSACAINPATGQGNLVTMSEKRELEIGAEEHEKVLQTMTVLQDEKLHLP